MKDRIDAGKLKNGLKDIRELLAENTDKWTPDQVEAARQTLNAVDVAVQISQRRNSVKKNSPKKT